MHSRFALAGHLLVLSRSLTRKEGIFSEYDYHLAEKGSQPADSDAIEIKIRFAERKSDEWPDEIAQILSDAVQVEESGLQSIILRVTSQYDDAHEDFNTSWDFLDLAGNELTRAKNPHNII